ncbi:MAG: hypothetical protein QM734_10345 [Cyclobacteriaceae bacterium]
MKFPFWPMESRTSRHLSAKVYLGLKGLQQTQQSLTASWMPCSNFERRSFDSVEVKKYNTALSKSPLMTIQIQDVASQIYPLTIFPFEKGNESLVGKINNEAVLLNPLILREIFKKKDYFKQK